jgi:hypothetical protein
MIQKNDKYVALVAYYTPDERIEVGDTVIVGHTGFSNGHAWVYCDKGVLPLEILLNCFIRNLH